MSAVRFRHLFHGVRNEPAVQHHRFGKCSIVHAPVEKAKTISEELWNRIMSSMPIPCVDIIVYATVKHRKCVLLGYRKICPHKGRWALPGGRIIKNESIRETANRQLNEISLDPTGRCRLVGVYPVNSERRSDISICLSTRLAAPQEPRRTMELSRFIWQPLSDLSAGLGSNYRAMLRDFASGRHKIR